MNLILDLAPFFAAVAILMAIVATATLIWDRRQEHLAAHMFDGLDKSYEFSRLRSSPDTPQEVDKTKVIP